MDNTPGTRLEGYEFLSPISSWRELFVARDLERDQLVTIEIVPKACLADEGLRAKLERSVRQLGSLGHAALWEVRAVVQDGPLLAIVTENVWPERVADRLRISAMSPPEATAIALNLAGLLERAHALELAFGHLTPADVLRMVAWTETDSVKVWPRPYTPDDVDRLLLAAPHERSALPLELLAGRAPDARTDVFALGSLLVRMLAGPAQVTNENPTEHAGAATITRHLPTGTPPDLTRLLTACLSDDPAERPTLQQIVPTLRNLALRPHPQPGAARSTATAGATTDREQEAAAARARELFERERQSAEATAREALAKEEAAPPRRPVHLDENVQFSVYRPRTIQPDVWYPLLAFAHLAARREDEPGAPDPIEEVHRQAGQFLQNNLAAYHQSTDDSAQPVPREGELRFVPQLDGIEFNPSERRFRWEEPVHREEFRLRASTLNVPRNARGRLTVFLGNVILAEVNLAIRVQKEPVDATALDANAAVDRARRFRTIFASYSHRDEAIVEEFEQLAAALGDRYLRDVTTLRTGERWEPSVLGMIDRADLFQLFWSWNVLDSPYVRQEYEYALARNSRDFVRPVYWQDPLPQRSGLPPPGLRELHFFRVYPRRSRRSMSDSDAVVAAPAQTPQPEDRSPGTVVAMPPPLPPEVMRSAPTPAPASDQRRLRRSVLRWPALRLAAAVTVVVGLSVLISVQQFSNRAEPPGSIDLPAIIAPGPPVDPGTEPPPPPAPPQDQRKGPSPGVEGSRRSPAPPLPPSENVPPPRKAQRPSPDSDEPRLRVESPPVRDGQQQGQQALRPNTPPSLTASCNPCAVSVGQDVALVAEAIDRDKDDVTYRWSGGAGSFRDAAAAKTVWTAPLEPGPVPLTVTVSDGVGGSAAETLIVQVTRPE